MDHFVQSKFHAAKTLDDRMKKAKLDKLIPNCHVTYKVRKNKTKTMDAFLCLIPSFHCITKNEQ